MSDNMTQQPGVPQPGIPQPGVPQPGVSQPGIPQPGVPQPGVAPAQAQPAAQPAAAPAQAQPTAQPKKETPPEKTENKSSSEPKKDSDEKKSDENNGDNNKKNKKKKRKTDWGGRIITAVVSIILGIVIGIASVYGTVAAVIYSIGTQSVSKSVSLVDTLTGLEIHTMLFGEKGEDGKYEGGWLSGRYADEELKLKDLVENVVDAVSGFGDGTTLENVNAISPFVGKTVKDLLANPNFASLGIPLDYNAIMSAPIAGGEEGELILADYIVKTFMSTQVGGFVGAFLNEEDSISPLIKAFCYGQEGIDYVVNEDGTMTHYSKPLTINDFFASDMLGLLDNVPLDLLLTVDNDDALVRTLAYGDKNHYTLSTDDEGKTTVDMNQMRLSYRRRDGEYAFYDIYDTELEAPIEYTSCEVDRGVATITFDTGRKDPDDNPVYKTWYVNMGDGKVWQDAERTAPLCYSKVTIGSLRSDAMSIVETISLPDIVKFDENNPGPIKAIVYTPDNKPRTIADLRDNANDLINDIKVADILEIKYGEGNPLESIIFKESTDEHGNPVMVSMTIKELGDNEDIIDNIKLADVLTVDENTHPAVQSIIYKTDDSGNFVLTADGEKISNTLKDLTSDSSIINKIQLDDVITVDENTHPALKSIIYQTDDNGEFITDSEGNYLSRTLNDLSNDNNDIINGIKLSDVMDTKDSMLLSIIYEEGYVVGTDGKVVSGKSRTLKDFEGEGAQKIIDQVKLADVLNITEDSHKALIFLAYGSDKPTDTPRTLGTIREKGDDLINEIPLSYIITPNLDDKIVTYLIYGIEGIHFDMKITNVEGVDIKSAEMLQRHIAIFNDKVYNEYGEQIGTYDGLMTYTEGDVTHTLTTGTITKLTTKDGNEADVYYLVDADGNNVMFEETTLHAFASNNNLITKLTSRLTAKDVLGDEIDNNAMLKHLADTPIDQLSEKIETLTFHQVFADEIYQKDDVTGELILDTNGNPILTDIWAYMLTVNGENKANDYTVIGSMHDLVENMKENVHDATLNKLTHDGLIVFTGSTLTSDLKASITIAGTDYTVMFTDPKDNTQKTADQLFVNADGTPKQTLGELTVEEMIVYVDGIVAFLDTLA